MWAKLLVGLLPSIIQFVEQLHGPKTGPTKFGAAVGLAQNALTVAAASGAISATAAADIAAISTHVQSVVTELKSHGKV